jgi:signal transduction histidine kinase
VRRPTGDLTSTDLAELLRSLTRAEEAGFNAAGIRLLLKLSHMSPKNGSGRPEASEARAWVDAGQLRRALLNVLRNAQQSACREVVLEIQVHPERVDILVADDGRGMEPDVRDRAFEPFFTTRPRGTGLGLALTRQIVEMHGGRVHMDTEPGNGCRVTISLPRARADDSSPPGSTGSPFADEESAPSPSEPPSEPPAPLPR